MSKLCGVVLAAIVLIATTGCPAVPPPVPPASTPGDLPGGGGTIDDSDGDVSDQALNFGGIVRGTVALTSNSSGATDTESARKYFPLLKTGPRNAWLTDMAGNRLKNAAGTPYEDFTVDPDGTFTIESVPVGVDFVVHVDIDGDGKADLRTILHVPESEGDANSGILDGAVIDPLSTLTAVKIEKMLDDMGITPDDLDVNAYGLTGQTRDAFFGMFDDAGILTEITLEDIMGMSFDELVSLFEELVPATARRGMEIAEDRIGMSVAKDVQSVVERAARIFLKGGMVIADEPGGIDLSSLASLPNVETMTFGEFHRGFFENHVDTEIDFDDMPMPLPMDDLPSDWSPDQGLPDEWMPEQNWDDWDPAEAVPVEMLPPDWEPQDGFPNEWMPPGASVPPDFDPTTWTPEDGIPDWALPDTWADDEGFPEDWMPPDDMGPTDDYPYDDSDYDPQTARDAADPGFTLYYHTAAEVDRNFAEEMKHANQAGMNGPMIGEHFLTRMAQLYLDGKTITLGDLHTILVDPKVGMGVRFTYTTFVGEYGWPQQTFETNDGSGIAKDVNWLYEKLWSTEPVDPRPEAWARFEERARALMVAFLADTRVPTLEELLPGLIMNRVPSVDEFTRTLRSIRVHVPWNLSGPSTLYVVATADLYEDNTAQPVRVNLVTTANGRVQQVNYDPSGDFFLGYGYPTGKGQMVHFIRADNGRPLHDHDGRFIEVDMANVKVFQPVGGTPFFQKFSRTEVEWPLAPWLYIPNPEFDPTQPPDPESNPMDYEALVLMKGYGAWDALRVTYDETAGEVTQADWGQWYLTPDDDYWDTGYFLLISEDGDIKKTTPGDWSTRVKVDPTTIDGFTLKQISHTWVFGKDVPNPGYNPEGAPYYDDIDGDNKWDADEPTFAERHILWDPSDWQSTFVEKYFRRADNDAFPRMEEIDWGSNDAQLLSGVELVPRNFKPRRNGYRYGRPNLAVNLLVAFGPQDFFNGRYALNTNTKLNPFMATAMTYLAMECVHTTDAYIDPDGPGPMGRRKEIVPVELFMPPVGDPIMLVADGFEEFAK